MPNQAEILPGRRNREGCSIRGRRGRLNTQASTSMTPAVNGREQLAVDTSIQDTPEREIALDSTNYSPDEYKLPSEQMHEPDNHKALPDGDSERLAYDGHSYACSSFTQTSSTQKPTNGSNYAGSRDIFVDIKEQPEEIEIQGPTSTRISLQQYLAQQQIVGNYALEFWKAGTLYDGPLPVIPQLANPDDWFLQVGTDNDHDHDRESDLETVRDETCNGIYD
ncbi:hypothetical protein F4814DRAFT_406378 [Daldinia grandis]|nr:hypothetical protein F4814DRAFT_406378 [Daldinia grandis]